MRSIRTRVREHTRRSYKPLDPLLEEVIDRLLAKHWPESWLEELMPDSTKADRERITETY